MIAKFGDLKKIRTYVQPPSGQFALEVDPSKDIRWDHCREQFAAKFTELITGFYFSHPPRKSEDIGEFITRFELVIGLNEYSKFSKTDKENILWLEPNVFWTVCPIRRSLLTILLRCGINYCSSIDNFDDVLFGDHKENIYIKETKSAVIRFMFGFTCFKGKLTSVGASQSVIKHGWREEFINSDNSTVRKKLMLPENKNKTNSLIGVECLWN